MKKRKHTEPEMLTEVQADDFLGSLGIHLILWGRLIEETDPNDFYEPFTQMRQEMEMQAEVLAGLIETYPRFLKRMHWPVPEYIGVVKVNNPLRQKKEQADLHEEERPDLDSGGYDDDTSHIPF